MKRAEPRGAIVRATQRLPVDGEGMRRSGLVLVNPPWAVVETMRTVLPWLAQAVATDGKGCCRLETLAGEGP